MRQRLLPRGVHAIQVVGPAGPLEAGFPVELGYELEVSNLGRQTAGAVSLESAFPPAFQVAELDSRCSEPSAGSVSCRLEGLLPAAVVPTSLAIQGVAPCADIEHVATAENISEFAGEDLPII